MKADALTRRRAKELRGRFTDAERILWSRLKGRQLFGWQFRAQHPLGPYIIDFACVPLKLAIEVDGWTHSSAEELAHDEARRRFIETCGWAILRFTNAEVYKNLHGVLSTLAEALPPKV